MPVRDLRVGVADTGTESKGSTETQEGDRQDKGVLQDRVALQEVRQVALQGVCRDRQDRRELRDLQEVLGSETVEVLQTGRQEEWVHVEGSLLVPEVGVVEVVEDQSRRHRGLRQVVCDWVVEEPLREEVCS